MIRELTEKHLEDATDDDLAEAIRDYDDDISAAGLAAIIGIIRLRRKVRAEVIGHFRHTRLVCNECGAASCLHGYSDE